MRVLLVCGENDPRRDGVADYTCRLATELARQGVRTEIAAAVDGLRQLHRCARDADLVHVQYAPTAYRAAPGARLLGHLLPRRAPLVTTVHEYGGGEASWAVRAAERRAAWDRETWTLVPAARRVLATNAGHAELIRARFAGRRMPIVVPIGANVEAPRRGPGDGRRAAVRGALGAGDGTLVLAFFGFVHPVKGLRYAFDAVAELRAEARDVRLLVVGGFESLALRGTEATDFEAELRGEIGKRDLDTSVTIFGHQPPARVSQLLEAADAVVLPFTHGVTTKSGSLLTAFAHRRPVLATLADDDELRDGENVLAIERVRDGAAVAAAVRRLLAAPDLAPRLVAAGAAFVAERDWERIAARHREIYADVLARPAGLAAHEAGQPGQPDRPDRPDQIHQA